MPSEIERKFLLGGMPPGATGAEQRSAVQGYLVATEETEVRLREMDVERWLTVKRGRGEAREEVEVLIEEAQFDLLWPLTEGRRVSKTRFLVPLDGGHVAEVDRFDGALEGLVTVEVEFDSVADSRAFEPPPWFGREVTGDHAYANQTLALDGRPGGPQGAGEGD